ncbi:hypothetical protein AAEX37_01268 [Oligella sp. MSHR50489EDL]
MALRKQVVAIMPHQNALGENSLKIILYKCTVLDIDTVVLFDYQV